MRQKVFTLVLVLVIVGLMSFVVLGSQERKRKDTRTQQPLLETSKTDAKSLANGAPIFFYGNSCPHCKEVENWMRENEVEKKIEIVKKEVYENNTNAMELVGLAEGCGLSADNVGVPFLYTPEGKCWIGAVEVIGYLRDRIDFFDNIEASRSAKEGER